MIFSPFLFQQQRIKTRESLGQSALSSILTSNNASGYCLQLAAISAETRSSRLATPIYDNDLPQRLILPRTQRIDSITQKRQYSYQN